MQSKLQRIELLLNELLSMLKLFFLITRQRLCVFISLVTVIYIPNDYF